MLKRTLNYFKDIKLLFLISFIITVSLSYSNKINEAWFLKYSISAIFLYSFAIFIFIYKKEIYIHVYFYVFVFLLFFYYFVRGYFNYSFYNEIFSIIYLIIPYLTVFLVHNINFDKVKVNKLLIFIYYFILSIFFICLFNYLSIWENILDYYSSGNINIKLNDHKFNIFFHNRNLFAISLMSCFPVLFFNFNKLKRIIISVIMLVVIYLTECRNTLIAYIFFYIFIFIYYKMSIFKKYIKRILYLNVLILIIFFIMFYKYNFNLKFLQNSHRIKLWISVVEIIKENFLFGTGIGNFDQCFLLKQQEDNRKISSKSKLGLRLSIYAHNVFLEIIATIGVIGVVIHLIILYFIFHKFKLNEDTIMPFSGFIICFIMSLFGYLSHILIVEIMYFLYIGVLLKKQKKYYKKINVKIVSKLIIILFLVMSLILVLAYQTVNIIYYFSLKEYNKNNFNKSNEYSDIILKIDPSFYLSIIMKGNICMEKKDYDKSLKLYNRALKYAPGMLMINYKIGLVYQFKNKYYKALKYYLIAESGISEEMKKEVLKRICEIYVYKKNWKHAIIYFNKLKSGFSDELDNIKYQNFESYVRSIYKSK